MIPPIDPAPPAEAGPAGYRSEQSKRRFARGTWALAIVAFLLSAIGPIVLLVLGVIMMIGEALSTPHAQVRGAAVHDGRLWYLAPPPAQDRTEGAKQPLRLMSAPLPTAGTDASAAEPELHAEHPRGEGLLERPWLLSAEGSLWIVTEQAVSQLRDGQLHRQLATEPLSGIGRPFVFRGQPAMAQLHSDYSGRRQHRLTIHSWQDGAWRESWQRTLQLPEGASTYQVEVLPAPGRLHLFVGTVDDEVLHRELQVDTSADADQAARGEPPADGELGGWSAPLADADDWGAALLEGQPAVLRLVEIQAAPLDPDDEVAYGIVASVRDGAGWREHLRHQVPYSIHLAVRQGPGDSIVALTDGSHGGIDARILQGGGVTAEHRFAGPFPYVRSATVIVLSQLLPLLLSLLVALALSFAMAKHRLTAYHHGGQQLPYASLLRRAVAQAVDVGLTVSVPLAILLPDILARPSEISTPLIVFVFLLWGLPVLVVLSALEGRWGCTPGKWLVGIRVLGTDLQPCGFGRALVRNLLMAVDGIFHYLVGVVVIALSEHWQRLGDQVAKTVVLRASSPPRSAPLPSREPTSSSPP